MAVIEKEVAQQETTQSIMVRLTEAQAAKLRQAAAASGQSMEDFAAAAIADTAQNSLSPAQPVPDEQHRLDTIFGIFKDSPELDALMEHIHEGQRRGIEQFRAEEAVEEAAAEPRRQ